MLNILFVKLFKSDKTLSMLVSVIVPVYNSEKYLSEALDSILASEHRNIEVICVNDGSSDASLSILRRYAEQDKRVKVYSQLNSGVCAARNYAISLASGEFILPVDSDNRITPTFISRALSLLISDSTIKVVAPRAMYFGDKEGEWNLPPFSLKLLARKNILDTCAMYRKADWLRVGGYCTSIKTREDWAFWIAILKDGGRVVRLPEIEFFYRVRATSKRATHRHLKSDVIDTLNRLYPDFFERELGGPLRQRRSLSRFFNVLYRLFHPRKVKISSNYSQLEYWIKSLPIRWVNAEGDVIHNRRNELRVMNIDAGPSVVVKSFAVPNFINRIVYGIFRKSKAQRSFEYAKRLDKLGIKTPMPVAYYTERCGLLFSSSFYVSLQSQCRYTFYDVISDLHLPNRDVYLRYLGEFVANMHLNGVYPLDFSGGNILIDMVDGKPYIELVDLNRMAFGEVDIYKGCCGFERLNLEPEALSIVARQYAISRGFDEHLCIALVKKYRWHKHKTL